MRISDWSSDVCSSDLPCAVGARDALLLHRVEQPEAAVRRRARASRRRPCARPPTHRRQDPGRKRDADRQIGRASCRERVCQYVEISLVAVYLKKKNIMNTSIKDYK